MLKDFCYDVYKDEEGNTRLKQNIRYKGEPVLEDVDLYEKQETSDYSALSDADLQNKIQELTEKRDRLNTLANARFRELPQDMQDEITEYCKARMDYGPYRNAENSMGIVDNIDSLEEAVK